MRNFALGLLVVLNLGVTPGAPVLAQSSSPETWSLPEVVTLQPDWDAVRAALPDMPSQPEQADPLAALTTVAAEVFPAVAQSPVPVLLPFAIEDYMRDRAAGSPKPLSSYAADFEPSKFFLAGPTGYDATYALRTRLVPGFGDIAFAHPVDVQISAFNTLYEIPAPKGAIPQPAGEIEKLYPGIRRQILESTLRYSFERFGIQYVVSIQCFDGRQEPLRLACRNADRVAVRFLRALRLQGGKPGTSIEAQQRPAAVARPETVSEVFAFHSPGKLLPGTGMRSPDGVPDRTVFARIRFPLASAPAYINSQSFMHGGDCNQTGSHNLPGGFRCSANHKPLVRNEGAPENYAYPWRDNFCENRHYFVGQCPSGLGHQGVDIRAASCRAMPTNNARCQPYLHEVVAARDGMILREVWNETFFLVINVPGERLRFRHLHMNPRMLDADGILSGRVVKEGERLGTIGNFNHFPGWTTTHLHFEAQVPTRDGWVRVNPYMTLVAAYEHLIRARGTEIEETDTEVASLQGLPPLAPTVATAAKAIAKNRLKARVQAKVQPKVQPKGKIAKPGKIRLAKVAGRKQR